MNTLDRLIEEIQHGYELVKHGRNDWIRGTLQLAKALYEARQQFPSNQEFGIWLEQNNLNEVGSTNRAALINMGEYLETTARVLAETRLFSYRLIWSEEIEPRLSLEGKTASLEEVLPSSSYEAENGEIAESNGEIPVETQPRRLSLRHNNPLSRRERGQEVHEMYRATHGKNALKKAMMRQGANDLWQLILTALDHGFLVPNNVSPSSSETFPARMLFPGAPRGGSFASYDMSTSRGRAQVKDVIMPAAIACKEAILAEPHRVEEICDNHRRAQAREVTEQRQQQEVARVLSAAPGQQEIVFYGERFWPARHDEYDYDQVRAAVWCFRNISDGFGMARGSSPSSVAISIRHMIKFLVEYATHRAPDQKKMKTIFAIIKNITLAWERNPDGECKFPGYPIGGIEGRWD